MHNHNRISANERTRRFVGTHYRLRAVVRPSVSTSTIVSSTPDYMFYIY